QRRRNRRRQRFGCAAQTSAPHQQIGDAREGRGRAVTARQHVVRRVREVLAEQVAFRRLAIEVELGLLVAPAITVAITITIAVTVAMAISIAVEARAVAIAPVLVAIEAHGLAIAPALIA